MFSDEENKLQTEIHNTEMCFDSTYSPEFRKSEMYHTNVAERMNEHYNVILHNEDRIKLLKDYILKKF